jgi:hypothetical protein
MKMIFINACPRGFLAIENIHAKHDMLPPIHTI